MRTRTMKNPRSTTLEHDATGCDLRLPGATRDTTIALSSHGLLWAFRLALEVAAGITCGGSVAHTI